MKNKLLVQVLGGLALYLISTTLSFAAFSLLKPSSANMTTPVGEAAKQSGFRIDVTAPKTEVCPINGAKFTLAEKKSWETKYIFRSRLILTKTERQKLPFGKLVQR